ncbi:MAG: FkbM family methyltransferase [Isosphaeraceae bacterium]
MSIPAPVEHAHADSRISYAQNGEDVLLDRLFRGGPGTFMDVGGNHPSIDNNTYFFYLRGWRGVNIEPTPSGHALFREHRPGDLNLAVAISENEGELPFFEVRDDGAMTGLSTLSADVADDHRAAGFEVVEHRIPVRTVASLIEEHGIEPPDLLSIDVENHEGAVIRGIPLATWRPRVLVIEATAPLSEVSSHETWEPTLLEHGYLFAAFNGVNRFYLRGDLRDALGLFETPVNALDHYLRHDVVELSRRADETRDRLERERADRAFEQARFEELRHAWDWGVAQAKHAQAVWENECASFARERVAWADALAFFERGEAGFKEARAGWDFERAVMANTQAEWEQERALWEQERASMAQVRGDWERERAVLQDERAHHHAEIAALQVALRPYQLLDRLRVVQAGYGLARRVKRGLAS